MQYLNFSKYSMELLNQLTRFMNLLSKIGIVLEDKRENRRENQ